MLIRSYRIALTASLALNAILAGLIWLYLHFEGFYSTIESVVDIFG
jgi:diacylglycerol kinase